MPLLQLLSATANSRWNSVIRRIDSYENELQKKSEDQLRKASFALRYRAQSGESLSRLLPEAFALVREAGTRALSMRHYKVQLIGGICLHEGAVVEMQTGEGKTLTATLPLYLAALMEKGAHLATANDYLAKRDAELMRPVYEMLGMSVGFVQSETSNADRLAAYQCDITYSTAKELGFDFLRDRLHRRAAENSTGATNVASMIQNNSGVGSSSSDEIVQRELNFILVDEADSLLIDEAKTPLIVSAVPTEGREATIALYRWCAEIVTEFQRDNDYEFDPNLRNYTLTDVGRKRVRRAKSPRAISEIGMVEIYEQMERAIQVENEYFKDRQYVVRDDEVIIVDEYTGRMAEGRKWRAGIHQAIEAREGLEITFETGDAARITMQDFFLRYDSLCGMTGTIANSATELKKIYEVDIVRVPTNRPPQRKVLASEVYGNADLKWAAVVDEVDKMNQLGRPVLIGTRSIDQSEHLSKLLTEQKIEHKVLNARHTADEAEIVGAAGQRGAVTVATNMAGRGTDIKLGEGVHELGGMHVICTELHESARIDRQLIGRCGRQGDPGSYRLFLSLDDEIIEKAHGSEFANRLIKLGQKRKRRFDWMARRFQMAQSRVERKSFQGRKLLLHQDKQRFKAMVEMGQDPYLDNIG